MSNLSHSYLGGEIPGPAGTTLAAIEAEHAELEQRNRDLLEQEQAARRQREALDAELVEATLAGPAAERKILTRIDKAQAVVDEPWQQRRQAVAALIRQAEARWHEHVEATAPELADALYEQGEQHRDAILVATDALRHALEAWNAANQRCAAVLRILPFIDGQALPRSSALDQLHAAVRLLDLEEIPPPGVSGDTVREHNAPPFAGPSEEEQDAALSAALHSNAALRQLEGTPGA